LIWAVKAELRNGAIDHDVNQPRSRVCPNAPKNAYVKFISGTVILKNVAINKNAI
jgi:hypothetical protein